MDVYKPVRLLKREAQTEHRFVCRLFCFGVFVVVIVGLFCLLVGFVLFCCCLFWGERGGGGVASLPRPQCHVLGMPLPKLPGQAVWAGWVEEVNVGHASPSQLRERASLQSQAMTGGQSSRHFGALLDNYLAFMHTAPGYVEDPRRRGKG